jgi:hypothetical protein
VSKYALDCLVLTDDDFSMDPHWHRMDCTVKSWVFGMVAPDLIEAVSTASPTSRTIWLGLEEQFIENKETRAIILDAEFRTLVQGDLSVTDYCNKMKRMADALGTLGEPVLDRTLVLNVLRGLNEQYSHMAAMIKHARLFPSYSDVCADLLIEEVTLASKTTTPTAFVASSSSRSSTPRPPTGHGVAGQGGQGGQGGTAHGGHGGSTPGGGSNRQHRRWRSKTFGGGSGSQAGMRPLGPWPSQWNPLTGTFAVWPGQPSARPHLPLAPLPPRPQAFIANTQQQYTGNPYATGRQQQYAAGPSTSYYGASWTPPPQQQSWTWDPQVLANNFSTMTLTLPLTDTW